MTKVPLESTGLDPPVHRTRGPSSEIHWSSVVLALALLAVLRAMKRFTRAFPGPPVVVTRRARAVGRLGSRRAASTRSALPAGLALAMPLPGDPADADDGGRRPRGGQLLERHPHRALVRQKVGCAEPAQPRARRVRRGRTSPPGCSRGSRTGADSRTAVALSSGGQTALTGSRAAARVALVVAFLTGPLALLPEAALGAILLSAAIDLFDFHAFRRLARIDRRELSFALVATAGVIWVGVLQGVFVAVMLTLAHLVLKVSRPEHRIMGWHPERDTLVSLRRHPDARLSPQITVFLFEGR
jgi:MFS superfamily sulfate permease-like transporter